MTEFMTFLQIPVYGFVVFALIVFIGDHLNSNFGKNILALTVSLMVSGAMVWWFTSKNVKFYNEVGRAFEFKNGRFHTSLNGPEGNKMIALHIPENAITDPEKSAHWSKACVRDECVANSAKEIAYVFVIKKTRKVVGEYTNGLSGFRQVWHCSIVNPYTNEELAKCYFEGGDPPAFYRGHKTSGSPDTGGKPSLKEVCDWGWYTVQRLNKR